MRVPLRGLVLVAFGVVACSNGSGVNHTSDAGAPSDAGPAPDAGRPDAGTPDGGPGDAGVVTFVPLPVAVPANAPHWTFYTPQMGGPNTIYGASLDEGGNLWVAGGEEGLFVLRAGASRYQRFTMMDGLRPYGYMPDGSDPPGDKYLSVISVAGAWAGTAFVGYQGKAPGPGEIDCESNWDGPNPDPAIYKSGDADKVTLTAKGISVIHYDISSGPGLVPAELRGREKLCNIIRIRYDKTNDAVWFGGNHGFAMGSPEYPGPVNCQWDATNNPPVPTGTSDPWSNAYGHEGCNGVLEHVHPAINGYAANNTTSCCVYLTDTYYGIAVDPVTNDVWFGGLIRTTKFHYGSTGKDYYTAESQTEDAPYIANRIDVWPDQVEEPQIPMPDQRVDDDVSGAAAMSDGSVWVSSFVYGLAHIDAGGSVTARVSSQDGLVADKIGALVADPLDGSVWAGAHWDGGISRLINGAFTQYDNNTFGWDLANQGIVDLQSSGTGFTRKIVVSWAGTATMGAAVGVYDGP
jgi:hypothetical protein